MRINQGQEFVIGGYTVAVKTFDALIIGHYERDRLIVTVQAVRARMGWREGTREAAGRSEGAGDSWSAATQACVT